MVIGAIVILSRELNAFSPELIALLERLAKNVSFGLDNFDRADEKAKADEQKERLARMFAAEGRDHKIRSNSISPGLIDSPVTATYPLARTAPRPAQSSASN